LGDFKLKYKGFGDRSILIEWPSEIDESTLNDVLYFKNKIEKHNIKEIVDIKSAYNSILISYNYTIGNVYSEIMTLKTLYSERVSPNNCVYKQWRIPVCYDGGFALDLEDISVQSKLSKTEIIALHSTSLYTVYFIGFLPGFLYLGGLDERLYFPRKSSPRLNVKKGAVAIGGTQTGVYPNESPGGWNIIGNSPISFFNVSKKVPCFAKPGDKIQFYAVSKLEYDNIKALVDAGVFQIESEVIDD